MDDVVRELGFNEIRYVFQMANLSGGSKGQFYLRAYNPLKFFIPKANTKYNKTWRDEWVMVGGDWGSSVHIGETEFPVPIQCTGRDKWDKRKISAESEGILRKI